MKTKKNASNKANTKPAKATAQSDTKKLSQIEAALQVLAKPLNH